MISQEALREVITYDPITGLFLWRVNRCRVRAGVAIEAQA